jgi:hypothetical protein
MHYGPTNPWWESNNPSLQENQGDSLLFRVRVRQARVTPESFCGGLGCTARVGEGPAITQFEGA